MILSVVDKLNEWAESFRNFIQSYYSNPLLWIGLFLAGIVLFYITYGALHRDR